jgi:hypothetical protein
MITEHTVVRSGKSKRKPFNSSVADYLLIIATFLGISLDAGQPCLKSPGFNPRALTAASGSRPHASTFSFGTIIAPIIALAFSGSCASLPLGLRCGSTTLGDTISRGLWEGRQSAPWWELSNQQIRISLRLQPKQFVFDFSRLFFGEPYRRSALFQPCRLSLSQTQSD